MDVSRTRNLNIGIGIVVIAITLAFLTTAQAGVRLAHDGQAIPWLGLWRARLTDSLSYALFMPALCWLARRYPIGGARWARSLLCYLVLSVGIALAKEAICVTIGNLYRPGVFVLSTILAEDFSSEMLTVWALSGVAHALAFRNRFEPAANAPAEPREASEAAGPTHITVRTGDAFRLVHFDEIESIDAQGNYARLATPGGRHLVRETMSRMEARLGSQFVRVHRRVIVNIARVARIEPRAHGEYWVVLASGARLPTGRSYKDDVRRLLR